MICNQPPLGSRGAASFWPYRYDLQDEARFVTLDVTDNYLLGVAIGQLLRRHAADGASRLGAMVGEVEAALDAIFCLQPASRLKVAPTLRDDSAP